uniref:Prevent-host-death family protein n=1 Tax=Candidatus Kentrum sp. FW TaxID=2126338 RepID=A0A450TZ96_9GAMM|nr:MAG: hypothetical protein BECKFW1821B_GA0114236_10157 [Candidatus Kentron sp. FW]VFJ75386.1 MAG: hypothetical protein BECKFW1821C_GA0114237_10747 [Candidatus Kentron sp. FW]
MNIHPQFIGREGAREYAVIPIEEFRELAEALEDYRDLQALRAAKVDEAQSETRTLTSVIDELGLDKAR